MFDGNANTFYIAANNTGGARGQMGYTFAAPVAPVECRVTARNDAYFGDSPKDVPIQWCSDGIDWHTTDSPTGLTWTTEQIRTLSITP
ncbi:hypothetical protein JMJ56_28840 [Belnapia sp. T18]|uniref:Uncharacterized protein n=1 Tax=Belnapia arida TaxID=2804533 RepID=A0ABS1UBD9_9PROT|nr:hypothetical protein [Belnapia arida]MBL6081991.1 hypothetical protein [Belnapia arida]